MARYPTKSTWAGAMALAWAAAGVANAAPGRAFDLQCEDERYRIDLAAARWCAEPCEAVSQVRYRDGSEVGLMLMHHFSLTYDLRRRVMTFTSSGPGDEKEDVSRSRCRERPFSGFPPPEPVNLPDR